MVVHQFSFVKKGYRKVIERNNLFFQEWFQRIRLIYYKREVNFSSDYPKIKSRDDLQLRDILRDLICFILISV